MKIIKFVSNLKEKETNFPIYLAMAKRVLTYPKRCDRADKLVGGTDSILKIDGPLITVGIQVLCLPLGLLLCLISIASKTTKYSQVR